MKNLTKLNEWDLAIKHKEALKNQDYILAGYIQREINNRIDAGTIDKSLAITGFIKIGETKPTYSDDLNGLFDKLK
jgi:hypothetical protein